MVKGGEEDAREIKEAERQEVYIKKNKLREAVLAVVNKNLTGKTGSVAELTAARDAEMQRAGIVQDEGQVKRKGGFGLGQ